ncbi:MAG TPA: hypothetical protein VFL29_14735 [Candidatus Dormibacteraeota bacterium]|nr:hypothetical protein [Candidatus Dormibacteraeota bacterium]
MSDAAAFVAWLGGAVIVLADGRRGLAAGLALLAAAAGGLAWSAGQQEGAIVLLAGGVLGAAIRFTIGPEGWGLMQPGSTPRLLLTVVAGVIALWLGLAATSGESSGFRVAVLVALPLLAGRALQAAEAAVLLTALAGLALVLGVVSTAGPNHVGIAAYAVAALVAAGASAIPIPATPRPRGT